MAKTIYQRIALDGGRKIASELRDLGKRGKDAFDGIQRASRAADSPLGKLSRSLQAVRRAARQAGDAARQIGTSFRRLGESALRTAGNVARIGGAMAAVATAFVGGTTALVAASGEAADEILRFAQLAGTTPEIFQQWSQAARTVGIEQDKLADILKDTNDRVGDFLQTGGGPMRDFFEQIAPKVGVTVDQFKNLSGPQALQLYVQSLQRANLSQQEMTFYLEAIASDATLLLPLLKDNAAAFNEIASSAGFAGSILSSDALQGLQAARLSLQETGAVLGNVRLQLAATFAPLVTLLSDTLAGAIRDNNSALQQLADRGLLIVIQLLNDFINLLAGNDDRVRAKWMITIRDRMIAFGDAVSTVVNGVVIPAWNLLYEAAQLVADGINNVFGTDISAQEVLITAAIAKMAGAFALVGTAIATVTTAFKALSLLFLGPAAIPVLIVAAIAAMAALIYTYWDEIAAAAEVAWQYVLTRANFLIDQLVAIWNGFKSFMSALWDGITGAIESSFNAVVRLVEAGARRLERAIEKIRDAYNAVKSALSSSPPPATSQREGFAEGGAVSGPGTGTSDSIVARLSNGEFVQRAKAVQHYGTDFMHAINRMAIPRDRLRGMLGFAKGGLVGFAEGGLAALGGGMSSRPILAGAPVGTAPSGRPLSLTIGGETVSGLTASGDAASQLERMAARRQLSSGGSKPSWRGRG